MPPDLQRHPYTTLTNYPGKSRKPNTDGKWPVTTCVVLIISFLPCHSLLWYLQWEAMLFRSKKGKVHPCKALRHCIGCTVHRGSTGIALLFLYHGTRRGWEVSVSPRLLFTSDKTPYTLYRRLCVPQGWSGQPFKKKCGNSAEWKNSFLLFRFQHAYIFLVPFPLLQICGVPVFISGGISNFILPAVENTKTRLNKLGNRNNCLRMLQQSIFSPLTTQLSLHRFLSRILRTRHQN